MEFLLTVAPNAGQPDHDIAQALRDAPRLCPVDGPLETIRRGNTSLTTAHNCPKDAHMVYAWDGHGVVGETAFSSGAVLPLQPGAIEAYIDGLTGAAPHSDMRGIFSLIRYDSETGAFALALDPLSQYPVFLFKRGDTLIASNNIYWVAAVARLWGYHLNRSLFGGAAEAVFGIGAGVRTGYDGISLFPDGQILTAEGESTGEAGGKTGWTFHRAKPAAYGDNAGYDALLDMAAARLKAYVRALHTSAGAGNLLFDLTGGQDSRICFAAAIGAGLEDGHETIAIFSGGNDDDPDRVVAHDIAGRFGARIGNYPENYDNTPLSFEGAAARAVFRQQGHSNLYHYDLGTMRLSGVCRVRGGGGELTRFFRPPPARGTLFWRRPLHHLKRLFNRDPIYREICARYLTGLFSQKSRLASRWAYAYCMKPKSLQRLFTKRFLRDATRAVHQSLLATEGLPSNMGMRLYIQDRCKRHVGYMSRGFNMAYGAFEPLVDPVLLAAAEALSDEERAQGRLAFDLIEKLGGDALLRIPFAPQSISEPQRRYLAAKLSVSERTLRYSKRALRTLKPARIKTAAARNAPVEAAGANQLGMNGGRLGMNGSYLWNNRDYFRATLERLPEDHACWSVFDRSGLQTAISEDGYFFKSETTATRGLRIFHTLLWAAEAETASGIERSI